MAKPIKPIKKPKAKQKSAYRVCEEYKNFFTKRLTPVSIDFIEKLCEDLVDWAINDETVLIADRFWLLKGILPRTAQRWCKKYPQLKQAYRSAIHIIGMRREEGSLLRKLDNATFFRTAANYSKSFRDTARFQSDLKAKQNEKTQNRDIQWLLGTFPDSKLVPEKPKD